MAELALFITVKVKPGKRDELKALWEQFLKPRAAANEQQSRYVYSFDDTDENIIRMMEVYESRGAFEANAGTPWFAEYMEQAAPLLDGPPEVHMATPQWVK